MGIIHNMIGLVKSIRGDILEVQDALKSVHDNQMDVANHLADMGQSIKDDATRRKQLVRNNKRLSTTLSKVGAMSDK